MSEDLSVLLERATSGDRDAIGQLLISYAAELRAMIAGKLPERLSSLVAIDDVLQVTYADALHAIRDARLETPRDVAAWLNRIAGHNLDDMIRAFDAQKRGGGRRPASLSPEESSQALVCDLLAAGSEPPSRQLRGEEASALLQAALAILPEDYCRVIQLYDLDGQSIEAVAAAIGRSPGAVHLLRHRAHLRLRKILSGHSADFHGLA